MIALSVPAGATKPIALDGSGRAPAAATPDWYAEHGVTITPTSPHAVTVPGAVAAWDLLVREHGTRSLGELLQPAIRYAEDGRCEDCWSEDQQRWSGKSQRVNTTHRTELFREPKDKR